MMAGLLVTSIGSGQLISRFGRYKPFPIVGTAIMTLAIYLLSGLAVDTPTWETAIYMVILGLGLGMTMQVLVLATQNAVPYELLGVATSGSTLARQVGGSIGVSVFGAIFANQLATHLTSGLPAGAQVPSAVSPELVANLPPGVHSAYVQAFVDSLQPVFLAAAAVSFVGFGLTWFLREIPLRKSVAAEGVAESFAMPRDAESLPEMERIVATLARRENRWRVYDQLARRAELDLGPAELWLLARLGEHAHVDDEDPRVETALTQLRERGLVTDGRPDRRGGRDLRARPRGPPRRPVRATRGLGAEARRRQALLRAPRQRPRHGGARCPAEARRRRRVAPATATSRSRCSPARPRPAPSTRRRAPPPSQSCTPRPRPGSRSRWHEGTRASRRSGCPRSTDGRRR